MVWLSSREGEAPERIARNRWGKPVPRMVTAAGFQPAEPDAYQKEIGRVITTLLPAWLQYRNTFVPLQKNKKEEKRS